MGIDRTVSTFAGIDWPSSNDGFARGGERASLLYMAATGCQWRLLPKEFPPYSTVQGYFYGWRDEGRWATINHHLVMTAREAAGREASASAGVIDS